MSTSLSLLLLAAGAILAFAVDYEVEGVDIQNVGIILLIVGVTGLALSMLFLASFAPFGDHGSHVERTTTSEPPTGDEHTITTRRHHV